MRDGHGALRQLTMDNLHTKTTQHQNFPFPGQNEPQIQNNHQFLQIGWEEERDIVTQLPKLPALLHRDNMPAGIPTWLFLQYS